MVGVRRTRSSRRGRSKGTGGFVSVGRNFLKGGLADKQPYSSFDNKQLKKGVKVEMEHTDNFLVAKEIASDHLTENSRYYDDLKKIENSSRLRHNFEDIRNKVTKKYPSLKNTRFENDEVLDDFHKHNTDLYAGVNPDKRKKEILYASALENEIDSLQRGIIWHEFGHLIQIHIDKKVPDDDLEANKIVFRDFGTKLGENPEMVKQPKLSNSADSK